MQQQSLALQAQPSPQLPPTNNGQQQLTMNQPPASASPSTTALTTQDPYSMTQAELARYRQLFHTYATPDDDGKGGSHVLGGRAVELFSKSGLDRESLKVIWTMVDDPVDNKLDDLEFGLAMHIIVCITKKGLAMPRGALPPSLTRLRDEARNPPKAQQQHQGGMNALVGGGASVVPGGTLPGQQDSVIPSSDEMGMQRGGMHPQMAGLQQQQQPHMQSQMGGMQQMQPQMGGMQPGMMQPQMNQQTTDTGTMQLQMGLQPQPQVGGQNVDDAFAGLSNEPVDSIDDYSTLGGMSATGDVEDATVTESMAVPNPSIMMNGYGAPPLAAAAELPPASVQQHQRRFDRAQTPQTTNVQSASPPSPLTPPPPSGVTRAVASNEGLATAQVQLLRAANQRLQAELISLRARAASVSDEEMEAQSQVVALAGEIAELSEELSEAKEELAAKRERLAEALAVLRSQEEKKETLVQAIAGTRSTNETLTNAIESVEGVSQSQQSRAVATAAAAREEAEEAKHLAETQTADLFSWDAPAPVAAPAPVVNDSFATWEAPAPTPVVNDTSLDQDIALGMWGADESLKSNERERVSNLTTSNHSDAPADLWGGAPSVVPSVAQPSMVYQPSVVPSAAPQQQDAFSVVPSVAPQQDAFGAAPHPVSPQQPHGKHNRVDSYGSYGLGLGMMGGGALSAQPQVPAAQPAVEPAAQPVPPPPPSPTKAEMEAVKRSTAQAETSLVHSANLVRTLSSEVSKFESAARAAEVAKESMEGKKKKGSFGGKKKARREYEKALQHAVIERGKANEARAQLAAAEREAAKSRKETEIFRVRMEELEVRAAKAASYAQAQKEQALASSSAHSPPPRPPQQQQRAAAYVDPFGAEVVQPDGGDYANPFL